MKDFIVRAGSGAALGFTAATLIYPHGAQFGGTIIDGDWMQILLPIIVAVVSAVWPQGGEILKRIVEWFRNRNVLQSTGPDDVLAALTVVEKWAAANCTDGSLKDCVGLRLRILESTRKGA